MSPYNESELIINPDGSIYHLRLHPGQITDTIVLVGDQGRVAKIGGFLSRVENLACNREFISLSGYYNDTKITVLSTGIGPDNTDIVVNELDALANINLDQRQDHPVQRRLNLVRIGTSGCLQPGLPAGTAVSSAWSVGLDGLMPYYQRPANPEREQFERSFFQSVDWPAQLPRPYAAKASSRLLRLVEPFSTPGITLSAHGFYGPQGRQIRAKLAVPDLNARLRSFQYNGLMATNFEMESSALYGLSELLGHDAVTVCLVLANRTTGNFKSDYTSEFNKLIQDTLNAIT